MFFVRIIWMCLILCVFITYAQAQPKTDNPNEFDIYCTDDFGPKKYTVDSLLHSCNGVVKYATLGTFTELPYKDYPLSTKIIFVLQLPKGTTLKDFADARPGPLRDQFNAFLNLLLLDYLETGRKIILRIFHEVNANWYPWGAGQDMLGNRIPGNTPRLFQEAWCHMSDLVGDLAYTDLNFTSSSTGLRGTSDFPLYFDGPIKDCMPDIVSIAAYNRCGSSMVHLTNRTFANTFEPPFRVLRDLVKPGTKFAVSETATTKLCRNLNRPQWYAALYESIDPLTGQFPDVVNVNHFLTWKDPGTAGNRNVALKWRNDTRAEYEAFHELITLVRTQRKLPTPPVLWKFVTRVSNRPEAMSDQERKEIGLAWAKQPLQRSWSIVYELEPTAAWQTRGRERWGIKEILYYDLAPGAKLSDQTAKGSTIRWWHKGSWRFAATNLPECKERRFFGGIDWNPVCAYQSLARHSEWLLSRDRDGRLQVHLIVHFGPRVPVAGQ